MKQPGTGIIGISLQRQAYAGDLARYYRITKLTNAVRVSTNDGKEHRVGDLVSETQVDSLLSVQAYAVTVTDVVKF